MLRPREVKELCPSHTAKDPQGWDHTASEQSDRCGLKLSLPLYHFVVLGGSLRLELCAPWGLQTLLIPHPRSNYSGAISF